MSDTFQCSIDALSDSLSQSIKRTKRPPKRVVVSLEFLQDLTLTLHKIERFLPSAPAILRV